MNINTLLKNIHLKEQTALAACSILALLTLVTFFSTIYHWHDDWKLAHQEAAPTKVTATDEKALMIGAIPSAHIFGMAVEGELPITDLQLSVTGIVKVDSEQNGSASKAYISISGQPSKIYQTGDELPDGVKVYQITPDAVILQNDGRLEKLPLPRQKLEFKPRSSDEFETSAPKKEKIEPTFNSDDTDQQNNKEDETE